MNLKSVLRPQDLHLVLNSKTLNLKLFHADGWPRWVCQVERDSCSGAQFPYPSTGALVLTGSENPNFINVNQLPNYSGRYYDIGLVWEDHVIDDKSATNFKANSILIYRLKSFHFNQLKTCAQVLPCKVGPEDLKSCVGACLSPVVYFSIG